MTDPYPPTPPDPVTAPRVLQRWERLTFVHWRYPPDAVQAILPAGLEVDVFDGSAWVGLVPFVMADVRLPRVGPFPWMSTFPETNIRTYVRGPEGCPGVWFASLDITRLAGVVIARTTYRVPYAWSWMRVEESPGGVHYRSRRRWPGPRGAAVELDVQIGAQVELGDREAFLANRWRFFDADRRGGVITAPVAHGPWTLHHAEVVSLTEELTTAAGLPAPTSPPVCHFSPGVDARVGRLERLQAEPVGTA